MSLDLDYGKLAAAMIAQLKISSVDQLVLPSVADVSDKPASRETEKPGAVPDLVTATGDAGSSLGTKRESDRECASGGSDCGSSDDSVILPAGRKDAVNGKPSVRFGAITDELPEVTKQDGYFATNIRHERAKSMRQALAALCGAKLPKAAEVDIATCTYTAGTMPTAMANGKARLRMLAAIGDSAITLALACDVAARGKNVEAFQNERSTVTSGKEFCRLLTTTGLVNYVSYAPGVDPATTNASATAFEALVGVLVIYRPFYVVMDMLRNVKVIRCT